jgi:vancomycin resistance protein VanW
MWLQHNKVVNLKIASQHLHGVILAPGQVLSFWRCLGRATARKGYLPGMVLHNGSFSPQVGGGLCQLSNLIYWMTLHTPLTVTERWRHSFDVFPDADRTQPFGSGATVSYNYIDLQIRNDTPHTYQLQVWVGPTHLRGEWRASTPSTCSYQVYESEHRITHEPWGGYVRHNCIRRRVWDQKGILLRDEYVTENHAVMMYEPLLAESKPS